MDKKNKVEQKGNLIIAMQYFKADGNETKTKKESLIDLNDLIGSEYDFGTGHLWITYKSSLSSLGYFFDHNIDLGGEVFEIIKSHILNNNRTT